jgi:hypothetical protein
VLRVAADVLSESSIGLIATAGDPLTNDRNALVGADFLFLNTRVSGGRTLEGEAWVQRSSTSHAVGNEAAIGLGARLAKSDGWRFAGSYRQFGAGFHPALGFISRAGVREATAETGFMHVLRGKHVQQYFVGLDGDRIEQLGGGLQSQVVTMRPLEVESAHRDFLRLYYAFNREVLAIPFAIYSSGSRSVSIQPGDYHFRDYGFDLQTGPQRRLGLRLSARRGDFYDGTRSAAGGEVSWKPSKHFSVRSSYDVNRIRLPAGDFTTHLIAAGTDVNFSSTLSWTNLLQFDNVSEVAGLQSHLHWIPKAGRELSFIVNHARQDLDRDGHFQPQNAEYGMRLSYTLRY